MDYGDMLSDSFGYAKDAVWGRWVQWLLLVVSTIIFPFLLGYIVRVYRGENPAPEVGNWVETFIDGLKLLIVDIIYAIPIIIVAAILAVPATMAIMADDPLVALGAIGIGLLAIVIVGLLITLISTIGVIRFARTGSIGQAFAFGAILEHIGKIGWGSYIIALVVLWVVAAIIGFVVSFLGMIPFIGGLIAFILSPVLSIFSARYMARIYESAPAPA